MSRWKGKKNPWFELVGRERAKKDQLQAELARQRAADDREMELIRKSIPPKTSLVPVRKPTENALIDDREEQEHVLENTEDEFTWNLTGIRDNLKADPSPSKKHNRRHLKLGKGIVEQI